MSVPSGIQFYFDVTTLIVVTVILFGFLAFMTGASVARGWASLGRLALYCALLAVGERFMAHAIVWDRFYMILDIFWTDEGVSLGFDAYYFVALASCLFFAFVAYYSTRASLMVRQYPWLYERTGPFGWRHRG
ncbi:MAG: hypothetical protein R3F55_21865 [Alphaproteobacteria bacterium]